MSQRAISAGLLLALAAGCSGGSSSEKPPAPGPLTGQVPLPGVTVAVAPAGTDAWATAVSDAAGKFTLPWDGKPYDIAVVRPAMPGVFLWPGLSRNPIGLAWDVYSLEVPPGPARSATVTGTARDCTSGCITAGACAFWQATAFDGGATFASLQPSTLPISFSVAASWYGADTLAGTLLDLWWTRPCSSGPPADFLLGQAPVTLHADSSASVGTIPYAVPPTATLAAHVVADAGVTAHLGSAGTSTGGSLWAGTDPSFSFAVPDVAGIRYTIAAGGTTTSGGNSTTYRWKLAPGTGDVAVAVRRPPEIVAPANGAPLPASRLFSWTAVPGAVYLVGAGTAGWAARIITTATQARLPDLAALGYPQARGSTFYWGVAASGHDQVLGSPGGVDPAQETWSASSASYLSSIP